MYGRGIDVIQGVLPLSLEALLLGMADKTLYIPRAGLCALDLYISQKPTTKEVVDFFHSYYKICMGEYYAGNIWTSRRVKA